jgi:hypothetical protein
MPSSKQFLNAYLDCISLRHRTYPQTQPDMGPNKPQDCPRSRIHAATNGEHEELCTLPRKAPPGQSAMYSIFGYVDLLRGFRFVTNFSVGVYLTDLTFIEDGIASVIKNTELINFAKRAKTAEVIRDIQQYQNVPYALNPVPDLQEWILDHMKAAGDVHEMYDKSLIVEPREREEEKIARLLSESGFL